MLRLLVKTSAGGFDDVDGFLCIQRGLNLKSSCDKAVIYAPAIEPEFFVYLSDVAFFKVLRNVVSCCCCCCCLQSAQRVTMGTLVTRRVPAVALHVTSLVLCVTAPPVSRRFPDVQIVSI